MLETIREFALEKLESFGEADRRRRLHGAWFATLAECLDAESGTGDQAASIARLGDDYPNLLPAHDNQPYGLTVHNAATGHHALVTALVWWPLGMVLAAVYFVFAYRMFFRTDEAPKLGTSEPREMAP